MAMTSLKTLYVLNLYIEINHYNILTLAILQKIGNNFGIEIFIKAILHLCGKIGNDQISIVGNADVNRNGIILKNVQHLKFPLVKKAASHNFTL